MNDNAEACEAILHTLARHQIAESQCLPAEFAGVFAEQGILEIDGHLVRGRRSIQASFEKSRSRPSIAGSPAWPVSVNRQTTSSHVEFVSATEARCHSHFVATAATGIDHTGRYSDRFVYDARSGAWVIAHRAVTIDTAARTSVSRSSSRRNAVGAGRRRPSIAGPPVSRRAS